MIDIVIADDQELVRSGLRMILEPEPDLCVVADVADGPQAVAAATTRHADVVLMDVRMPGGDGIEATRRLRSAGYPGRVLMLTTFDLDEHVFDALAAGASGFLLKDMSSEEIVAAVRAAGAGGEGILAPALTRRLIEHFIGRGRPIAAESTRLSELTAREREVLRLIALGLSNAEISRNLHISETTVKTHVARVLMKLDLRDRVQAVVFAYQNRLGPEPPA